MCTDTAEITIVPLRRGERAAVAEVFDGLGERSRRLRFAGPKPRLTERELEHLVDVDGDHHMALVARDETGAVGIARWVRDPVDRTAAEIAFAVVDRVQREGVGSQLVAELRRRALRAGIARLHGSVAFGNEPALALLRRLGRIQSFTYDTGYVDVVVDPG
jgi:GNAT superfamily N-acetyltransferase